jgi:hypothetical protein
LSRLEEWVKAAYRLAYEDVQSAQNHRLKIEEAKGMSSVPTAGRVSKWKSGVGPSWFSCAAPIW